MEASDSGMLLPEVLKNADEALYTRSKKQKQVRFDQGRAPRALVASHTRLSSTAALQRPSNTR